MPTSKDLIKSGGLGRFKVLLMAPPKSGKTCTALLTSPKPVYVMNCDSDGALLPAANLGADFDYDDVFDFATLKEVVASFRSDRKRAKHTFPYKTMVIDTVSLLSQHLEAELKFKGAAGWDLYRDLKDRLLGYLAPIFDLPCNIVMTAHAVEGTNEAGEMGYVPLISGQSKVLLPALCQDWLWLEVTPDKEGKEDAKREFLLGAQGKWKHGCRSLRTTGRMKADFTAFAKKIGVK